MRNLVNQTNIKEKAAKKVYNLLVEKLVREASDNFIYFKEYETALKQLNEALNIESTHEKALILKGDILLCLDKDDEALECFERAILVNPYSSEAYGSKAGLLDILGRTKEALLYCEKAFEYMTLKNRHLLPSLYDQKISILLKIKKYEEARLALKKCVRSLSEEDGSYIALCYQGLIESSCKEKQRIREMVEKMSLKLVY